MWFKFEIYVLGFCALFWIFDQSNCERDHNTCSFYYWKVDWYSAVRTCKRDNKELLCYKSKEEIDDITEAFRLSAYGEAELEIWLSKRNCTKENEPEKCLSLHIKKMRKSPWHYFQSDCRNRFPFVCCIREGEKPNMSDVSSTSSWDTSTSTSFGSSSVTSVGEHISTTTTSAYCKGVKRRGLFWPDTSLGDLAILPCPGKSTGEAKWNCSEHGKGEWANRGPDMTQCRSLEIQNIKEKYNTSSVSETLTLIGNVFEDRKKEIFGEDLADVISIMKLIPARLFKELDVDTDLDKWTSTKTIVEKSTSVIDRMIELQSTWEDIGQKRRPLVGTELLSSVDGFGAILADSLTENIKEESILGKNMALQVLQSRQGESLTLPQGTITSQYSLRGDIILDEGYDKYLDLNRGNVSVVYTLYSNLSHILNPQTFHKNTLVPSTINSAVVSATVIQERKAASIGSKVRILVEHLVPNPNATACVFWNMRKNRWDTEGCRLEGANDSFSMCVCDHLTNFAILMDYKDVLDDVDQLPFFYITVIGCTLSIICLALCILVFTCYSYQSKHAWGLRYSIHRNLCLTLLIANLVFILGVDKTDNQRLCAVVAGMLHYFFLSAFSWMLLEGVHIYMLLVVVFASRRSHWEKYYIFGYGFPLIVVAITAISRPMYYGTEDVCWLSIEKGTIWAFMGPVACILLVNVAALLLAQYKASNISVKDDNVALAKRWLRITFILFPVLGITWIFGFMYVGKRFIVAGYLFAFLNSFQGFSIFVCHCLMDKKARNMILESFKKKNATVTTGSSGMQKRQNNSKENEQKVSNLEQNGISKKVDDINKPRLSFRGDWKLWHKWHKPWSFCFDMPVTESKSNNFQVESEDPPKPLVLQWNNLRDRIS